MPPDLSKKRNTPVPIARTPPPKPPGITTSPSSRRTTRPMPSPLSSAHQSLQLSHHFPACHGCQPRTPATSGLPRKSYKSTISLTPQKLLLSPPTHPPNSSGTTSHPPKPSVDGALSPPRSSATEAAGASPSVPSATPVPPPTICLPSGTTSGHAKKLGPSPQEQPHATPHTPEFLEVKLLLLQLLTQHRWFPSSPCGVLPINKVLVLLLM